MTELSALHVKITGDANGLKAATGVAVGAIEKVGKSAEDSARVFERAFKSNEKSLEQLRRAIDPLYAASKRYETAVGTLDKALKLGNVTQAQHARMLDQLGTAYLRTGDQAQTAAARTGSLGGAFGRLGNMSGETRNRLQQVGFQLQDIAIQLQSGTRASVVFAQQGSQIASVFGPVGAIIGTLAAVGIPALAFAFSSAGEKTRSFDDALAQANESLNRLRETAAIFSAEGIQGLIDKYGELNAELMTFIEAQRTAALDRAFMDATSAISALREEFGFAKIAADDFTQGATIQVMNAAKQLGLTSQQVRELSAAFEQARAAATFEDKVAALAKIRELIAQSTQKSSEWYFKLLDAEDALRQMNAEGAKAGGWIDVAISGAANLASQFWDAAQAAAAMRSASASGGPTGNVSGLGVSQNPFDTQRGTVVPFVRPGGGGGGGSRGGGGGSVNPIIAELESLRQSLLTQEEMQIQSFARQQETLRTALEQRLITQQEYAAMMEDAQRQHSDRMGQLDAFRYGDGLQKAGAFFGGMATAFQSGNEKMAAIGKKFAAVEALINAWRAYNQTLADPSLPFFAKFAAAASVLAAGMNAVSAIKGGGGGGGAGRRGGGGGGGAANSPAAPSTYFNVQLTGGDNFGKGQVRDLITAINKEIESGAVIRGIRAT